MELPVEVEVEAEVRRPSLSPSRAGDFKTCPLLYRFRAIDKLPESPSPVAVRGTVIHKVLEDLFDLPAPERTPARAQTLVRPSWEAVLAAEEGLGSLFDDDGAREAWLDSCDRVLARYFDLEDPRRLEPAERELYVETELDGGLVVRGIIDRLDIAADGSVRVCDYKTGSSVRVGREATALFQLRIYALILYRTRGVVPAELKLIYLGNSETVSYSPDLDDLLATERVLRAVRAAIELAEQTGDFQPQRSGMCTWCSFRSLCPAWGGTPPPLPERPVRSDQKETTPRQT